MNRGIGWRGVVVYLVVAAMLATAALLLAGAMLQNAVVYVVSPVLALTYGAIAIVTVRVEWVRKQRGYR
jgi:hypothetical protein